MKVGELYAKLAMDFSQFDRDEATAKRRTEALGGTLGGVLKNAFSFGLGMSFFSAVQRGFKATVGSALDFNSTMQQAKIGFTTMLGSERRATVFLSDLAKFAAHTPFEMGGLLETTKRMMALGFAAEDVLPTLTAVGDAAAALGSGQEGIDSIVTGLGQIKTAGRVTSIAMMMLARAGVPSWELLAEAIGKTTGETRQLVEKGVISADVGINALTEGMERRFPGMMSKMEDSWRGVTSTIKDVWRMTLGAVTTNLFQRVNEWLKRVRDTAQSFYDAFQQGGLMYAISKTFGPQVAASIQLFTSALRGLWGVAVGVGRAIIANWSVIAPLASWVLLASLAFRAAALAARGFALVNMTMHGTLVQSSGLLAFISRVIGIYQMQIHLASLAGIAHVGVLNAIKTALYSVYAALGPIGWALLAITGLLTLGISLWSRYTSQLQAASQKAQMQKIAAQQKAYEESAKKAAAGTDAQADALGNLGKAAKDNLQSFDEVHQLMEETADASMSVPAIGTPATPEMPEMDLSSMFDDLESAKPSVAGFFAWMWDGIKSGAAATWKWVADTAGNLWDGVKAKWQEFQAWFKDTWAGALWDNVKQVWDGLAVDLGRVWDNLKVNAKKAWDGLGVDLGRAWDNLKTNAKMTWGNLVADAGKAWDSLKLNASKAWGDLGIDLGNLWADLKTNAGRMWDALKDAKWEDLLTAARKTWGDLGIDLGRAWDTLKANARKTWDDLNIDLDRTWETLKANASKAWSDLGTDLDKAWAGLTTNAQTAWDDLLAGLDNTWASLKANANKAWASLVDGIKYYINVLITSINKFIRGFNKIEIKVPSVPLLGIRGFTVDIPDIPEIPLLSIGAASTTEGGLSRLAAGTNFVPQDMLAYLHRGEAVVPEAYNPEAGGRSGLADDLADTVAKAVYGAVRDALRMQQATQPQGQGDREIILRIGDKTIARAILPAMVSEGQRQGLRLVVQPQGV